MYAVDSYNAESGYVASTPGVQERRRVALAPSRAELADQISYWEGVRVEQIASGQATGYSRDTIKKGDRVRIRGHWRTAVRVNQKSVSVSTDYSWTDTTPYAKIQKVLPPLVHTVPILRGLRAGPTRPPHEELRPSSLPAQHLRHGIRPGAVPVEISRRLAGNKNGGMLR